MRAERVVAALAVIALFAQTQRALADDEPHDRSNADAPAKPGSTDPRAILTDQLAAQAASIDRALATVDDKLAAADAARTARVRAAYRLIQPLGSLADDPATDIADAGAADRMADARRRAAARLLLARDAAERNLLADEADHLRAAAKRTTEARARALTIALPTELAPVARGAVARHFGTIEHDRSHTTLSRRGLDLEVEDHAPAVAPADGTIKYVGAIRGLDRGVVIDHGDYYRVIGKLGDIAVPVGAPVHRGDRLGRAAKHRIYVEVRVKVGPGGLAIDPEPLFAAAARATTGTGKR